MAVVPRRRSLIGRAAARAGATGADNSVREPPDEPELDPPTGSSLSNPEGTQTALHAARPGSRPRDLAMPSPTPGSACPPPGGREDGVITASGLEIVERGRPGRGFEGVAAQDSYAMDDPPSEEVRRDPRFARAFEPATELMDRQQLAEFDVPDTLTEDDLDAVLPPARDAAPVSRGATPRHVPKSVTPSPLSRGWIPSESSKSGITQEDPATERVQKPGDPATERITRDQFPPELLAERTVPTSFAPELSEIDDVAPPSDYTQPFPAPGSATTQPFDTGTQPSLHLKAAETLPPLNPPPQTQRESQRAPYADRSVEVSSEAPTTLGTGRLSLPGSQLGKPLPEEGGEDQGRTKGLPPIVGLVALVGSGGMIAGIGLGALMFAVLFLMYWSANDPASERDPLPPIELTPSGEELPDDGLPPEEVVPVKEMEDVEDIGEPPTDEAGDEPTTPRRRTTRPAPVVVPEPPPPAPAPAPVIREEIPDLEPVPVPEPDKKGPFGRGKKK